MDAIYLDYYFPASYDDQVDFENIGGTNVKDPVYGLYSDDGLSNINKNVDVERILNNADIMQQEENLDLNTEEIKILLPSGLEYEISMDTSTPSLLKVDKHYFQTNVRAMIQKIPGFFFSGYRQVAFFAIGLTNYKQYKYIVDTVREGLLENNPEKKGIIENEKK